LFLILFSLQFIRRWIYEIFHKMHVLFAILTIAALWYHVMSKIVRIYLILGISTLGVAVALHVVFLLYRNFSRGSFA